MEPRRSDRKACAQCHKLAYSRGGALLTCTGCKQAAYCGQECQRAHWNASHKKQCAQLREKNKDKMAETAKNESETACSTGAVAQASFIQVSSTDIMCQKKKGGNFAGNEGECANCSSSQSTEGGGGALRACTRCKAVYYCGRPCQIQHWKKGGHQQFCIPVEERRPNVAGVLKDKKGNEGGECPICLEVLLPGSCMTLPCSHSFHGECVQGLRRFGVQQACPLCRAELPPGPDKLFAEATERYYALDRRQQMLENPWQNMAKADRDSAVEIAASWKQAAVEGHVGAQSNLGVLYHNGQGVRQSFEEAARWYRKAADQGQAEAQVNLGVAYQTGKGVHQSSEEAARWYRKAADQGHTGAQSNLRGLVEKGQGLR